MNALICKHLKKIYYNKNVRLRNTVLSGYDTVLVNGQW